MLQNGKKYRKLKNQLPQGLFCVIEILHKLMSKQHEAIEINDDQYTELLQRVEQKNLLDSDWPIVLKILISYRGVGQLVEHKKITLAKLKTFLFGKKTEIDSEDTSAQDDDVSPEKEEPDPNEPKKKKGHGKRPSRSWKNAPVFDHSHESLKPGDVCPLCKQGKVYPDTPATWVRFVGQSPLSAEIHRLQRLRCNLCGRPLTATPPTDLKEYPTSTAEANATAAVLKYHAATPFHRLAKVLASFGYPIPRTRIYEMAKTALEAALPIFQVLIEMAAQADVVQNDDTGAKILSRMEELKKAKKERKKGDRTGTFTTSIVAQSGGYKIYLFFTGGKHAGENLADLLKLRESTRPPPTQVCDALSANTSPVKGLTEVGSCHDHARRNFYLIRKHFKASCAYVLKEWKVIYKTDKKAKRKNLTPEQRLELHQEYSAPVMERLKNWSQQELENKNVEPNSHLGEAIQYFLNQYESLTLFLRKSGVPLSNCECEQALKIPIAVRKMAYFYKTLAGAKFADVMFSLIATCEKAKVNVFEYLVALQKNQNKVKESPKNWLPWNYHLQLV